MATVSVRHMVDDVDAAITFYTGLLGFHTDMHPAPGPRPPCPEPGRRARIYR